MKTLILTLILVMSFSANAHVGGHYKENIYNPKFGGTLAKIENSSTSALVAELAKDGKDGLFLFLYDRKMNLITSSAKNATVTGTITSGRGKRLQKVNVSFQLSNDRFKVKLPEIKRKPYTVSIAIKENKKTSNIIFKNID